MNNPQNKISLLRLLIERRSRKYGCTTFDNPIKIPLNTIFNETLIKDEKTLIKEVKELHGWKIVLPDQTFPAVNSIDFETIETNERVTPKSKANIVAVVDCQTKFMLVAVDDLTGQIIREGRPKIEIKDDGLYRTDCDALLFYPITSKTRLYTLKKLYTDKIVPGKDLFTNVANKSQALNRRKIDINDRSKNNLKIEVDLIVPVPGGYSLNHKDIDFDYQPTE
jgi:hypothetical protein